MNQRDELTLIPKYEKYMQYIIEVIIKMPRTEKFNIGNEYKTIMYKTLENILYINKIEISKRLYYLNLIDAELSAQRVMLRLMLKNKWIDEKKFKVSMEMLYACIENKGMHEACLNLQNDMKHCKRVWKNYYIIKMDVTKYFQNIDKEILYKILNRKIKDEKLLWLTKEILYSNGKGKGLPIGTIISQIDFKFIIHSKDISIAQFELETIDKKATIKVKLYNEMADFAYSKLNKGDKIMITGYINNECEVIVEKLYKYD